MVFSAFKLLTGDHIFIIIIINVLEIRWLSAGQATQRLYELRAEVNQVVIARAQIRGRVKAGKVLEKISNPDFQPLVAYMADVFSVLNKTCSQMQTHDISTFEVKKNC